MNGLTWDWTEFWNGVFHNGSVASIDPSCKSFATKAGTSSRSGLDGPRGTPSEEVEESQPPRAAGESLERFVARLAWAKAEEIGRLMAATMEPQETLIACDTLSEVDGETFGKPKDRSDAARMMLAFSGKSHQYSPAPACGGHLRENRFLPLRRVFCEWKNFRRTQFKPISAQIVGSEKPARWLPRRPCVAGAHRWQQFERGWASAGNRTAIDRADRNFSRKKFEVKSTQTRSKIPTPVQFYPAIPSKRPLTEKIEGFRTTDSK